MAGDDNVWRQLWEMATTGRESGDQPVFDRVEQGEIAIDYLEGLGLLELIGDLFPVLFAAAEFALNDQADKRLEAMRNGMAELHGQIELFHRRVENSTRLLGRDEYSEVSLELVGVVEKVAADVSVANSLLAKFPGCYRAIDSGVATGEFLNENPEEKGVIASFLGDSRIDLRAALLKQEVTISDSCLAQMTLLSDPSSVVIATGVTERLDI
jgi:hypothetical protein